MSAREWRYPVFLADGDWQAAVSGFERRVKRFRAPAKVDQIGRVRDAMREAEADREPNGDEYKHVLYVSVTDYVFLSCAVESRYAVLDPEVRARVSKELSAAAGDSRPA
ncbi:hypothetical protein ACIRLA_28725 [Streptomyces sp. NPDC102364]|uniref:hypothetical protein n=1 Tax=Streptomyces sp. NPDC102364 TaxID=3366161 RepID=UPI003818C0E6